ncbi:MAG TPA: SRPBCC family protein [Actinomycetota bacterium]
MTKLREELEVDRPIDEVFAFVGDFANAEDWDPGVEESELLTDGPVDVGTRYRVVAVFNGRRLPIGYRVTEWDPPRRVVLEGVGSTFRGVDEIAFDPTPSGGTRITYQADLRLRGPLRLFEPLMRKRFEQTGREAMVGMRRALLRA